MKNTRFDSLLQKHAAILDRMRAELSQNLDTPAHLIIGVGCAAMGINAETWRELEAYRIERNLEAALKGRAWGARRGRRKRLKISLDSRLRIRIY